MATGTVKWVDAVKGYGFVAPDEGGDELFVDRADIGAGSELSVGAPVEFERHNGRRGRIVATNVVVMAPLTGDPERVAGPRTPGPRTPGVSRARRNGKPVASVAPAEGMPPTKKGRKG